MQMPKDFIQDFGWINPKMGEYGFWGEIWNPLYLLSLWSKDIRFRYENISLQALESVLNIFENFTSRGLKKGCK